MRVTMPLARAWTERSIVEWNTRCDRCRRWRLRARYHEMHAQRQTADDGFAGTWWRECLTCAIQTLTAMLEKDCAAVRSAGEMTAAARSFPAVTCRICGVDMDALERDLGYSYAVWTKNRHAQMCLIMKFCPGCWVAVEKAIDEARP